MQGKILRKLVEDSGKHKQDVALELGVTKSYLSRLFKMERLPDATLFRIKDVFGVDKDYFSNGEKAKQTPVEKRMEELEQEIKEKGEEIAELRKIVLNLANKMLEQEK